MDICVSSNFERFVFHCARDDPKICAKLMADFETNGSFVAPDAVFDVAKSHMLADAVDKQALLDTIATWHKSTGYVLDPHTAVGVCAGLRIRPDPKIPLVCLACAHHAKFPDAVALAIGSDALAKVPPEPALTDLLDLPLRNAVVRNDINAVADFISSTLAQRESAATAGEEEDPPAKKPREE